MKKNYSNMLALAFLLFFCLNLPGQNSFQRTYGTPGEDGGNWVANTSTGYIVAGYTTTTGNGHDGLLLNLDFDGNVIWQKSFGAAGIDQFEVAYEVSDGFLVLGETTSYGAGGNDIWLLKISPTGLMLWSKTIGKSTTNDFSTAMIPVSGDRILISGFQAPIGSTSYNSVFYLLNSTGQLIWDRNFLAASYNILHVNYVDNGIINCSGTADADGAFLHLDLETGAGVDAVFYPGNNNDALYFQQPTSDGNIILSDATWSATNGVHMNQWLNKITTQGQTIWSKVYSLPNKDIRGKIESAGGGNFLLTTRAGTLDANSDAILVKIDNNGNVLWSKNYGSPGGDWLLKSQLAPDGGYISAGSATGNNGEMDILVIKTDQDGKIEGCCIPSVNVQVDNFLHQDENYTFQTNFWASPVVSSTPALNTNLQLADYCHVGIMDTNIYILRCPDEAFTYNGIDYYAPDEFSIILSNQNGCDSTVHYFLDLLPQVSLTDTIEFCPGDGVTINGQLYTQSGIVPETLPGVGACDTLITHILVLQDNPTRTETITFCPGESIEIGGQSYTQAGIVMDTIAAVAGCDTIVTYTLMSVLPAPSVVSIQCPDTISLIADPGTAPLVVNYDLPIAGSDCPCPGVWLSQTVGLPTGAAFPNGTTQVCYNAQDSCGQTASCCFTVTVREVQPCDVKVNGCMRYELLSITADQGQNLTYRIRVINNCSEKLIYTAIQLPDGVIAMEPDQSSIFTAESGREYDVRNPNYSPFYSIRFKSRTDSIFGGQSDIFKYTLPAQSTPSYMDITSRLVTQVYYEAHLNTFYCPIGVTPSGNRSESSGLKHDKPVRLFPNPTASVLWFDFGHPVDENIHWRILNTQGQQLISDSENTGMVGPQRIDLPESMPNGMYFFEISRSSAKRETLRFVLQR